MGKRKRVFAGSKPGSFYNADYYLNGVNSNYGSKDASGKILFSPYDEANYLPRNRQLAKFIASTYKPKTALVLGCARAYLVQALVEQGVDAQGIDISKWAIENAPEKIKDRLFVGDICNLSRWKTQSVDCVIGLDVFEHIKVPDLYTAVAEAQRVCKEILVIDVPLGKDDLHPDQSSGGDKSHVSVYSEGFWRKNFESVNLYLDGKDVYGYPDGSMGGTFIFRRNSQLARPVDPKDQPRVDIVMLNYNGLKFTPKCIETLYKNTDYQIEQQVLTKDGEETRVELGFNLIVVDNQSTDGSADYLNFASQSYPNMKVVYLKTLNSGFAEGVNIGLKHCTAPLVLLLNNDTLFTQKNWLSLLVEALQKHPEAGLVSPKLLYPDGRIQYGGASFGADLQPYHFGRFKNAEKCSEFREIPWATFACVLIRRNLFFESELSYESRDKKAASLFNNEKPMKPWTKETFPKELWAFASEELKAALNAGQTVYYYKELLSGLDEAYKLGTFEDVDFCCKARFNGWKVLYEPACRVYHYEGATVFTLSKAHYSQQQAANAALFYGRWRAWLSMNRNAYPEVYTE
ncbi:MAG: glycosyltransferase [Candidatus Bathyarchaeia archaeon]|jgi:GT2 family glycosyltransferase